MAVKAPERDLIRRVLPFVVPVAVVAFLAATALSGPRAGWSAAGGILVVAANLVASGYSLAWAATISPVAIFAVGLGGFVLRLTLFVALLLILRTFAWFSPVAFAAAFVPATVVLLAFEMRHLSNRHVQADLWYFRGQA